MLVMCPTNRATEKLENWAIMHVGEGVATRFVRYTTDVMFLTHIMISSIQGKVC